MKKAFLLITTFFCCFQFCYSQAGKLDSTFGKNGIVLTDFGASTNVNGSTGYQVLTGLNGTVYLVFTTGGRALITRILSNGTIDTTYGNKGYSQFVYLDGNIAAALQNDGKIVLVGYGNNRGFDLVRYNMNGMLDSTFSEDGLQTTDFGSDAAGSRSLAIQSDGKIVVAGSITRGSEEFSVSYLALARYNTDGTLDTTFSEDGKEVYFEQEGDEHYGSSVAIQSDGKIVVTDASYDGSGRVIRYNANGTPDTSFSSDAKQTNDFFGDFLALQTNGKIVVAGTAGSFPNYNFTLTRYNTDGARDTAFGANGIQTTVFESGNSIVTSVVIQNDGKIVVAGYIVTGDKYDFAVARYNTDGSADTSFSRDGKQITDLGSDYDVASSIALTSEGKIVVAGTSNPGFAIIRYNTNGTPDTSFSQDGKLKDPSRAGNTTYTSTAVQSDGKIVVAGTADTGAGSHFALARYNTDGNLDTTFSRDGKQTTDFGFDQEQSNAVAIQSDGKIVVAGVAFSNTGNENFAVARYNSDGTLDSTFSEDGKLTITGFGYARSVTIQSDGKIVVAGGIWSFALARINADGTLDKTFAKDGKQETSFEGKGLAYAASIQSDGKIVVAGYETSTTANGNFAVARYNIDGTLDRSFSRDGKQNTDFDSGGYDVASSSVIQKDGKIILAGGSTGYLALARYNTDGNLDSTFAEDGKLKTYFAFSSSLGSFDGSTIGLQSDGKIVMAVDSGNNFAVVRFNNNGSVDSSFGNEGRLVTRVIEGANGISGIAIKENKLYAVGFGQNPNNIGIIARYLLNDETNTPPTVTLTAPTNHATYLAPAAHIKLSAAASDSDGTITKVEFYNGNKLLHTETVIPYGYNWKNVPAGNYTLTAKAYDNSGNITTSAPVHIFVVPNKSPIVSIINPVNNQSFTAPATIHFEAAANDSDGRITRVEFYKDSTLLRTEYKYPFTYNWTNVPAGTYTITAKATDNYGAQTTSAPVTVTVISDSSIVSSRSYSKTEKTALNDALRLRLSPNPASNIVNIFVSGLQLTKPATISIISLSGIVLKTMQINNSIKLDVSALVSGVYTIQIISGDKILYKQFVKL